MKYILSIDQGTTSSRALIVAQDGTIVSTAQREFTQHFPQPGWVEHDPMDIWGSQQAVIFEALARKNLRLGDIEAIGITNQRETTLIWDRKTGEPVYNAIVWQDRRTTAQCAALKKQGYEEVVRNTTGLFIDPYFSATKIRWILDHIPDGQRRAEQGELAFGTIDTWLIWKLTGGAVHATDVTNASRTLLCSLETLDWNGDMLTLFNIPRPLLPTIHDSSGIIATTLDGIPIAGVAGDQQAALFGQHCFSEGLGKITYGTGCFILLNTGAQIPPKNPHLVTTVAYRYGSTKAYAYEGSVFMGGAIVQWLRDTLHIISSSRDIEALADSVTDTDGVYFVPAFTGLGAPHWDPNARGMLVGLSRGTTTGHIARAALEGIVFQVADILDVLPTHVDAFRVDGGASRSNMMMALQASLNKLPLERPKHLEVTALGAAYLAGLGTGYWKNLDELRTLNPLEKTFSDTMDEALRTHKRSSWKKAVACARSWEHE